MWQNGGGFDSAGLYKWTSIGIIASGVGIGAGVFFADMDGDGKDDYVWLDANGAAYLWLNGGTGKDGTWIWTPKGKIATGVGAVREDIRLADIDGDGKADYLWVDQTTGETKMWRNGGVGSGGNWIWTPQGEIATGVGAVGSLVRFADLGGTGRADYLTIVPNSLGVRQWLNGCGTGSGVVTVTYVSVTVSMTSDPTATFTGSNMSINPTTTPTESNMPIDAISQVIDSGTSTTSTTSTASGTAKSGAEGLRGFRVENMVLLVLVVAVAM
jgi:FG-GAP-like repeat